MIKQFLIPSALALTLISCGSSSSDPTDDATKLSGTVADGYLRGALVCADMNGNKQCDDNEPQATTGEGGKYSIDASAKDYPLIAIVREETIDEDTMAAIGTKTYTLSTPKGKNFISPITTMAQNKIEENPTLDADSAAILVKGDLGMSGESSVLYEDYASDTYKDSDTHKTLYQTAQMVARVMAEIEVVLVEKFTTLLGSAPSAEFTALLQKEVQAKVEGMAKELFTEADTYIQGAGANKTAAERAEYADDIAGTTTVVAEIEKADDEYTSVDEVNRKKTIINRDTSGDSVIAFKDVINSGGFVFANPKNNGELEAFIKDSLVSKNYNTTTIVTMLGKTEEEILTQLKTEGEKDHLTVNNDGSIEFGEKSGTKIKVYTFAKQSLNGLTLHCNEMINGDSKEKFTCPSEFTNKTVTFDEGDYRYAFTFNWYPRFSLSDLAGLDRFSFNELCPTIGDGDNEFACQTTGNSNFYDAWDDDSKKDEIIAYYDYPKKSFWVAADGKTVEMCKYTGEDSWENAQSCKANNKTIGKLEAHQLTSGEFAVVYPESYDSDDVNYRIVIKKNGVYYNVNSEVPAIDENKIQTYAPFNWEAYKKIANTFFNE